MECKKWRRQILFLVTSILFIGCASVELEERSFPLVAAVGYEDGKISYVLGFSRVDGSVENASTSSEIKVKQTYGASFLESKEDYEGDLNKLVDYNHLKVLVLEEDLLEVPKLYNEMLEVLTMTEEFPRNTYVCVVDDIEDLMEMEKTLPQDLGTYLEEYLMHHEKKNEHMVSLGDLLDEKENKELVLFLPYVEAEETFVKWHGYYVIGKDVNGYFNE